MLCAAAVLPFLPLIVDARIQQMRSKGPTERESGRNYLEKVLTETNGLRNYHVLRQVENAGLKDLHKAYRDKYIVGGKEILMVCNNPPIEWRVVERKKFARNEKAWVEEHKEDLLDIYNNFGPGKRWSRPDQRFLLVIYPGTGDINLVKRMLNKYFVIAIAPSDGGRIPLQKPIFRASIRTLFESK